MCKDHDLRPEARAITGESTVADVDDGDGQVLTDGHFEVAHHITQPGFAGHSDGVPI